MALSSSGIPWDRLVATDDGPRRLHPLLVVRVLLGGLTAGAFGLAAFGSVFLWGFGVPELVVSWVTPLPALTATDVTVVSVESARLTLNDEVVQAVHLRAVVNGEAVDDVAYVTGAHAAPAVGAVFAGAARRDPDVVTAPGLRRTRLPNLGALIALFPGIGLLVAIRSLADRARDVRLLRAGRPTTAALQRIEESDSGDSTISRCHFTYRATGPSGRSKVYDLHIATSDATSITDQHDERVLYDPFDPQRAVLLGSLPGDPQLRDDGSFTVKGVGLLPLLLLAPAAFIVVNVVGWWLAFGG